MKKLARIFLPRRLWKLLVIYCALAITIGSGAWVLNYHRKYPLFFEYFFRAKYVGQFPEDQCLRPDGFFAARSRAGYEYLLSPEKFESGMIFIEDGVCYIDDPSWEPYFRSWVRLKERLGVNPKLE